MSKCHVCRATSFRKVIERDSGGAMSHLGRFACHMHSTKGAAFIALNFVTLDFLVVTQQF